MGAQTLIKSTAFQKSNLKGTIVTKQRICAGNEDAFVAKAVSATETFGNWGNVCGLVRVVSERESYCQYLAKTYLRTVFFNVHSIPVRTTKNISTFLKATMLNLKKVLDSISAKVYCEAI